ncbi:hypothetical protein Taro_032454, partial [Colocasia esculenta]|nr:hypothetical protein [Colocasia esculenta]
MTQNTL